MGVDLENVSEIEKRLIFTEADLILLALYDGEKMISKLREITGLSTTAIYRNVDKLLSAGLVEERRSGSPANRFIKLTPRGARLAALLRQLEEELKPRMRVFTPE
ncbi:MAG: winged helix-turn-helix domain-containing protein [Thermofilum sp.]